MNQQDQRLDSTTHQVNKQNDFNKLTDDTLINEGIKSRTDQETPAAAPRHRYVGHFGD